MKEFKSKIVVDEEKLEKATKLLEEYLDTVDYTEDGVFFKDAPEEDSKLMEWAFKINIDREMEEQLWMSSLTEKEYKEIILVDKIRHEDKFPILVEDKNGLKILLDNASDIVPPTIEFPCTVYKLKETHLSTADLAMTRLGQFEDNEKIVKFLGEAIDSRRGSVRFIIVKELFKYD